MIGGISGYCHLVRLALYSRPRVVFEQSGGQESWLERGQRRRPARRLYLRVHESTRPTERTHHLVRSIIVPMIAMPAGAGDKVRSSTFPSPPTSDDSRESDNVLLAIASAEVPPKRGGKRNAINTNTVPFYYAKSFVIRCVRGNKEMAKGVARGGGQGGRAGGQRFDNQRLFSAITTRRLLRLRSFAIRVVSPTTRLTCTNSLARGYTSSPLIPSTCTTATLAGG